MHRVYQWDVQVLTPQLLTSRNSYMETFCALLEKHPKKDEMDDRSIPKQKEVL